MTGFGYFGSSVSYKDFKTAGPNYLQCDPLVENLRMNQQCKVCGEPAAGFHFGAFTCEGCKSFFGRSYNNLSSISECKNNGCCVINKKNRTSCKACRLRKCLMVGMSKSGSRYGRRSNWFKIHCLLQEQQQQSQHHQPQQQTQNKSPTWDSHLGMMPQPDPRIHQFLSQQHALGRVTTKEDLLMLGMDEYKHSTSPSISSPESHNSDSSVEVSDARVRATFFRPPPPDTKDQMSFLHFPPGFPPPFAFPPLFPPSYLYKPTPILKTVNNNVEPRDVYSKRFFLDAVLQSQRSPGFKVEPEDSADEKVDAQENPMDLSMKGCLIKDRRSVSSDGDVSDREDDDISVTVDDDGDEEGDDGHEGDNVVPEIRSVPMDLTAKV